MSVCAKINKNAIASEGKSVAEEEQNGVEGVEDSLWVFYFFFDRTSAAQTQGAHLDTHIWVCTLQAAGNSVSECAIRALGCTISCCARGLVMPQQKPTTYDYRSWVTRALS